MNGIRRGSAQMETLAPTVVAVMNCGGRTMDSLQDSQFNPFHFLTGVVVMCSSTLGGLTLLSFLLR